MEGEISCFDMLFELVPVRTGDFFGIDACHREERGPAPSKDVLFRIDSMTVLISVAFTPISWNAACSAAQTRHPFDAFFPLKFSRPAADRVRSANLKQRGARLPQVLAQREQSNPVLRHDYRGIERIEAVFRNACGYFCSKTHGDGILMNN